MRKGVCFAAMLLFLACNNPGEEATDTGAPDLAALDIGSGEVVADSVSTLDVVDTVSNLDVTPAPDEIAQDLCTPQCEGLECGDDGCGGNCGTCPGAAPLCVEGICQPDCTPECDGKECGDDGCGGVCGTCPAAAPNCVENLCLVDCVVDCDGKSCGDDGCGGSCGECDEHYDCAAGQCVADCDALCEGRECGSVGTESECDCGACFDDDPCTDAECTAEGTCQFPYNTAACDDGNPCTADDSCDEGQCTGTLLPAEQLADLVCVCESDDDCGLIENGNLCDGTLFCDLDGASGVCQVKPDSVLVCGDDNPCTDDSCDPVAGCQNVANDDNECGDDDVCNGIDSCVSGECLASDTPNCDDGDKCTIDSCDKSAGCQWTPDPSVCDDGLYCTTDSCADDACAHDVLPYYCVIDGACVPSGAENAEMPCYKCVSNSDVADWTYLGDYAACGIGKVCHAGDCCDHAANCDGKDCGNDGCGGNCGVCAAGWFCKSGVCAEIECAPHCVGKQCGPDGCGGSCGECLANQFCSVQGDCICLPDCTDKQCGSNGCGGSCGECPAGYNCEDGACVEGPCVPDCTGKECGGDGCEGTCGTCPAQHLCTSDGNCVCVPDCANKECGDNGCGGSCGSCAAGTACEAGSCVCQPDCDGLECGSDGCGGSCGTCGENEECDAGQCQLLAGPDSCVGHCGGKSDNCYCDDLCFLLDACCEDICDACPELESCTCGDGLCDPEVGEDCDNCPEDCGCDCGEECQAGACVSTACEGKQCGDNGCGGSCGDCSDFNLLCASGSCVDFACQVEVAPFYCVVEGACVPSGTVNPANECEKCNPDVDQLGWSPVSNGIGCGEGLACHDGLCCNYDCDGKVCGDDGCGGSCGECGAGEVCCAGGCQSCCDDNQEDWDGCTDGAITEWRANDFTEGNQSNGDVAVNKDGRFLVVWDGAGQALGSGTTAVYFRVHEADGTQVVGETLLASIEQAQPVVAALSDGKFMVATRRVVDGVQDVWGQTVTADGVPYGASMKLNSAVGKNEVPACLTPFAEGGYLAAWWVSGNTGSFFRRFDAGLAGLGNETATGGDSTAVFGDTYPSGAFALSFSKSVSNKTQTFLKVFDASGSPTTGAIQANTYVGAPQGGGQVAVLKNGNIVVVWSGQSDKTWTDDWLDVRFQRFAQDGSKIGGETNVAANPIYDQAAPAIMALPDGGFVIAWRGYGKVASWNILQRRFAADGTPGIQTQANVFYTGKANYPELAVFPDGGTILVWDSEWQDGSFDGVYVQRIDSQGNAIYR